MDFMSAVKKLTEGRCKGFRRTGWQKGTFLVLGDGANDPLEFGCGSPYIPYACDFLADDYELVNPKTETMEVKRWAILNIKDGTGWGPGALYNVKQDWVPDGFYQIELNGSLEIPVKPKAKHREEIHFSGPGTVHWSDMSPMGHERLCPSEAKFFVEWEE